MDGDNNLALDTDSPTTEPLSEHWQRLCDAYDAALGVVGDAEMIAAMHAFVCDLQVFMHGALDRGHCNGEFIRQGYNVQIEHMEDHLRARGKTDPDSGLDHQRLGHARCTLANALADGIVAEGV